MFEIIGIVGIAIVLPILIISAGEVQNFWVDIKSEVESKEQQK